MTEARSLTEQERSAAIAELETSRQRLQWALEGVTEEGAQRQTTRDHWSIADCAEHITAAEVFMPKLLTAATAGEPVQGTAERDDFIRRSIRDRSRREQAPERVRPRRRWTSLAETIRTFDERRAANLEFVRTTQENLRGRFYPHPFVGMIDCYQWLLSLAAHTERHAAQIEELRGELKV
jgi:DinB superfamily